MEKQVRISAKEYVDLLVDSEKLRRLERAGVDNWDWYGDALCGANDDLFLNLFDN